MQTRRPIVAGQFYPAQHGSGVDEINQCLEAQAPGESLPDAIVAGIVTGGLHLVVKGIGGLIFGLIWLKVGTDQIQKARQEQELAEKRKGKL